MMFEEWVKQFKTLIGNLKATLLESGVSEEEATDLVATVNEETSEMLRDIRDAVLNAQYLKEEEEPEEEAEETESL